MKRNLALIIALLLCVSVLAGCSCSGKKSTDSANTTASNSTEQTNTIETPATEKVRTTSKVNVRKAPSGDAEVAFQIEKGAELDRLSDMGEWSEVLIDNQKLYVASQYLKPVTGAVSDVNAGKVIVIDPGHQTKDSSEKEPIGPGSSEMKQKDTSGATGVVTGLREYELNLQVSKKLKEELEKRGYKVIMTRTQNEGEISCIERAKVANNANADAYIRIHANGVDNQSANGVMTICQTAKNPYNSNIYSECKRLSVDVLDEVVASTGAKREYVWETDTMTGNNWSKVPVTMVEMGYLSNPREDELMATDDYQWKIATGIANGIDRYFNEKA